MKNLQADVGFRRVLGCVLTAAATLTLSQCSSSKIQTAAEVTAAVSVTTYHYDNARSAIQASETTLTPANVNATSFGKLATLPVDGQVYAQPLIQANVQVSGSPHTVVYVATEHDSVYAFDADSLATTPLWQVSLLQQGETPVPFGDTGTVDISPEIGVTGTPVIDSSAGILYVVSKAKSVLGGNTSYLQRLHALNLRTGEELLHGPVVLAPKVPGNAPDAVNGVLSLDALRENQRSALALINGVIWITWASHGDNQPYHGWVVGYTAGDLSKPFRVFSDTPNGSEGGIWMSGNGVSADAAGNIYVSSGNGDFDPSIGNYSSSTFKLLPEPDGSLLVADSFTPTNQADLSAVDADYGVMGSILLPDQPGPHPHLLVTGAKNGAIYVLDRDNLGGYNSTGPVQVFSIESRLHQNALFYNGTLYVSGDASPLKAYPFLAATGLFATTPAASTQEVFSCAVPCFVAGSAPTVSSNGTQNAVLWTNDTTNWSIAGPGILRVYDPTDLTHELYDSTQAAGNRDQASGATKFTTPVVANGRVFLGGAGGVDVYGLLK